MEAGISWNLRDQSELGRRREHLANETGIQELTVQEAGPNMVLVTAAATVTIVSIAAIVIYFMRARKQPSNSESHAEESPAKSKRKARIDKNIEVKVRKD